MSWILTENAVKPKSAVEKTKSGLQCSMVKVEVLHGLLFTAPPALYGLTACSKVYGGPQPPNSTCALGFVCWG